MQLMYASASFEVEEREAGRPLVLVVDDHPAILDMLSWMLYYHGYQPACAANGQEALAWMKDALRTGRYPNAILLDLFMPVMDGAHFLTNLRACWNTSVPLPPVILLTVDKSNHDHLACNDVLLKPFHIRDLSERLKHINKKETISW
jgi:two-component system, chemotaxis family, chemotaxis protein CheY